MALPAASATRFNTRLYSGSAPITLHPGTYTNGILIEGNAQVTLAPGIYTMLGGGFSVSGSAIVTGTDVMIVNPASPGQGAMISKLARVSLSGLESGPYKGIAIMQAGQYRNEIDVQGQSQLTVAGVIYAPTAGVKIEDAARVIVNPGAGTVALPSIYGAVIANNLIVQEQGLLFVNPDPGVVVIPPVPPQPPHAVATDVVMGTTYSHPTTPTTSTRSLTSPVVTPSSTVRPTTGTSTTTERSSVSTTVRTTASTTTLNSAGGSGGISTGSTNLLTPLTAKKSK